MLSRRAVQCISLWYNFRLHPWKCYSTCGCKSTIKHHHWCVHKCYLSPRYDVFSPVQRWTSVIAPDVKLSFIYNGLFAIVFFLQLMEHWATGVELCIQDIWTASMLFALMNKLGKTRHAVHQWMGEYRAKKRSKKIYHEEVGGPPHTDVTVSMKYSKSIHQYSVNLYCNFLRVLKMLSLGWASWSHQSLIRRFLLHDATETTA